MTWSATDLVPTATPSWGMSGSAVAVGGRIARNAEAHGTVIGLDLDQADRQGAVMSRGGSFGATFQPVEGRVDVRFRLRVRSPEAGSAKPEAGSNIRQ